VHIYAYVREHTHIRNNLHVSLYAHHIQYTIANQRNDRSIATEYIGFSGSYVTNMNPE